MFSHNAGPRNNNNGVTNRLHNHNANPPNGGPSKKKKRCPPRELVLYLPPRVSCLDAVVNTVVCSANGAKSFCTVRTEKKKKKKKARKTLESSTLRPCFQNNCNILAGRWKSARIARNNKGGEGLDKFSFFHCQKFSLPPPPYISPLPTNSLRILGGKKKRRFSEGEGTNECTGAFRPDIPLLRHTIYW